MNRPIVSCVVEGHGEVVALPVLIRRVVQVLSPENPAVDVPRPHRQPRSRLVQVGELEKATEFAALKVGERPGGVLVVIDSDDDCPAVLGPELLDRARGAALGVPVEVVLAHREYEGWFLAAAGSLAGKRGLQDSLPDHPAPEEIRNAKGWVSEQMEPGRSYSETIDQPKLTAALDLERARQRSPSFDKLARSLGALLASGA